MEATLSLKEQYAKFKEENPKMRIRNIAAAMNVSEAELVNTSIGEGVTRLNDKFTDLLKEVQTMGHVMALTRNDDCVHERKGVYNNVSFEGPVGLVLDPDIDLRLFMMSWKWGFAVHEGERKSLQFFDKSGSAVHKIYLTEKSDAAAYDAIVAKYTAETQQEELQTEAFAPAPAELPDSEIDVENFRQEWLDLKDTHDFYGMLRKYKVTRTQAMRLAPEGHVKQVDNNATRTMLETAAERNVPIMVFVGNKGCIQIHTGEVSNLAEMGPWYNVLDPEFNMHLRTDAIVSSYLVKKPSVDGIINSLEVFDKDGELIVQFFGKRKPGIPELETWRSVLKDKFDF